MPRWGENPLIHYYSVLVFRFAYTKKNIIYRKSLHSFPVSPPSSATKSATPSDQIYSNVIMTYRPRDIACDGLDGLDEDPVAICGFSIKFPGDAVSPESFWKMLIEKRCSMTEFPASRFNKKGFYRKENTLNTV